MRFIPKDIWKAIKTLTNSYITHYKKYVPMKFKIPDRPLTGNDKEMIRVLTKHFYNVYNYKIKVD